MQNIFLISDTHFGHENILKFLKKDGSKLREYFNDIDHHDQTMISNWNSVVKPDDKVYHLGDVGFKNFTVVKKIFDELNGEKILIKGNHDKFKANQYLQIFKDIRAYHILDNYLLSHIPVHPDSVARWKGNIHGHLHSNKIEDPRYINVCVENINYTPISFEEIKKNYETIPST